MISTKNKDILEMVTLIEVCLTEPGFSYMFDEK